MSLFEHYSMNIPILSPSLDFLTDLHIKHFIVIEKSHIWRRLNGSSLPYSKDYTGSARVLAFNITKLTSGSPCNTTKRTSVSQFIALDPNNDYDECAVRHWLSFSDYFSLPHIVYFNSINHLVEILNQMWTDKTLLQNIHKKMRLANRSRLKSILHFWRTRLINIAKYSSHQVF